MKFCSVDIECNQPSGRIIQIGASVWDTQAGGKQIAAFEVFVDPLEPINWEHPLKGGQTLGQLLPFDEAMHARHKVDPWTALTEFWRFICTCGGKKIIQWGAGDMAAIQRESVETCVTFPYCSRILNAKVMYQMLYQPTQKLDSRFGLGAVVAELGFKFEGSAHNAYWDAYNTAVVYNEMFQDLEAFYKIKRALGIESRCSE